MSLQAPRLILALLVTSTLTACEPTAGQEPSEQQDAALDMATGDSTVDATAVDAAPADCVPNRAAYEETFKEVLETHCVDCHGEPLQFGAVYPLNSFEKLLEPTSGGRPIDLVVSAVQQGLMPPGGQTPLGTDTRQALVNWASCGEAGAVPTDPVNPGGAFDANRPVLMAPDTPPEGTDFFDLLAGGFQVSPDDDDRYECFYFEAPITEERFIRRIETIQDDTRVLHHVILLPGATGEPGTHSSCDDDNPLSLVYGWAPGQGALHFDEGGIRLSPGQRYTLQIHYNNKAGHDDVQDNSGVRIFHGIPEGPEVSMLTFGPLGFNIPANSTKTVEGWCRMPTTTTLLYSFPHMHEVGIGFAAEREARTQPSDGDNAPVSIVELDGWDFGSQYIYDTPVVLEAGDIVRTSCTFQNMADRRVRFGPNTADEMCFNFAYVSPPPPVTFCNQNERPIPYVYTPGDCAAPGSDEVSAPPIFTPFFEGEAPRLEGGDAPEGRWVLSGAELYLPSLALGGFTLDTEQSRVTALGTAAFEEGVFYFDAMTEIHAVANGVSFDSTRPISFHGPVEFSSEDPGALSVSASCGELPAEEGIRFGYEDMSLLIVAPSSLGPIDLELLLKFERQAL